MSASFYIVWPSKIVVRLEGVFYLGKWVKVNSSNFYFKSATFFENKFWNSFEAFHGHTIQLTDIALLLKNSET